jgi:hypothetical protein
MPEIAAAAREAATPPPSPSPPAGREAETSSAGPDASVSLPVHGEGAGGVRGAEGRASRPGVTGRVAP